MRFYIFTFIMLALLAGIAQGAGQWGKSGTSPTTVQKSTFDAYTSSVKTNYKSIATFKTYTTSVNASYATKSSLESVFTHVSSAAGHSVR